MKQKNYNTNGCFTVENIIRVFSTLKTNAAAIIEYKIRTKCTSQRRVKKQCVRDSATTEHADGSCNQKYKSQRYQTQENNKRNDKKILYVRNATFLPRNVVDIHAYLPWLGGVIHIAQRQELVKIVARL